MKKFYALGVVLLLIFSIQVVHASTFPDGCTATTKYSATTGHICVPQPCQQGDLFNDETGQPCSTTNSPSLVAGCNNTAGFSPTTGQKCDGSVPASTQSQLPTNTAVYVTPTTNTTPTVNPNILQIISLQSQYSQLEVQAMGYSNYQFEKNWTVAQLEAADNAPGLLGQAAAEENLASLIIQMQYIKQEIQALGGTVQ